MLKIPQQALELQRNIDAWVYWDNLLEKDQATAEQLQNLGVDLGIEQPLLEVGKALREKFNANSKEDSQLVQQHLKRVLINAQRYNITDPNQFTALLEQSLERIKSLVQSHEQETKSATATPYLTSQEQKTVLELLRRILSLYSWNNCLTQTQIKIKAHYHGFHYVLAIKKLLASTKNEFFTSWYQNPKQASLTLKQLIKNVQNLNIIPPTFLITELTNILVKLKNQIQLHEAALKNYGLKQSILASGIRLWSEYYYYKFSEGYFSFMNDLAEHPPQAMKNIPLINVKLSQNYTSFFTLLGSAALSGLDIKIIGLSGISYAVVSHLGQRAIDDLEGAITLGKKVGLRDTQIIKIFPITKELFGLAIYILLRTVLLGWNPKVVGSLLAGYAASTLGSKLAGSVLDFKHKKSNDPVSEKSWTLFVKHPVQHIVGLVGQRATQYGVSRFFSPHIPDLPLLESKEACLGKPKLCKTLALQTLGLPANATKAIIKATVHAAANKFHSSLEGEDDERMIPILQSYERLKELAAPSKK